MGTASPQPGSAPPTPLPPSPASRRPTDILERNTFVALVLATCGAFHALFARGTLAADGWYTMVAGRIVSRSGIPHHDTLTVLSQGREWVDQQWLAQLGIYGLWVIGGWPLTLLTMVAFNLAAFALAAAAARLIGASERSVAMVVLFCFVLGLPNTAMRAQILAYVLFAGVLLLLLTDERRPSRRVFLVFPILALWANIHGSVVLGASLVALRGATVAAAGLRARSPAVGWLPRAGALLALPWLCTLASPYALDLPGYYHHVLLSSNFDRMVSEWGPSTLHNQPFFYAMLLIGSWLVFRRPGALQPFARLAFLFSGIAGMLAIRNIVWFALIAAATLPSGLDALWAPVDAPRRPRFNLALVAVAFAGVVAAAAATASHGRGWIEHTYPRRAVKAVSAAASADPALKVFANETYADWLLFEDPQLAGRVAYDTRLELLTNHQLSTIFAFRTAQGIDWERAVRGYGVLVLSPSGDGDSVKLFERRPGTTVLFRDRNVVVLRPAPAG